MKPHRPFRLFEFICCLFACFVICPSVNGSPDSSILFPDFDASDVRDHWIEAEFGGTTTFLRGDLQLDEDLGDTNVDVDETLDLEDDRNIRGRLEFQPFSGTHLRAGYRGMEFQETTTISNNITVDGTTYSASDRVDSKLTLDMYEAAYRFDVFSTDYLLLSPMLQVNGFDFEAELDNETTGQSVSKSSQFAVPYPGIRIEVFPVTRLGGFAEARGIAGSTSNLDFTSLDLEGGAQLNISEHLLVRLGYRRITFDFEYKETNLDMTLGGPYATIAITF